MALIKFYETGEVHLSEHEAWETLVWFFGGNAGVSPSDITYNDRSFAQALLIEAVIASKRMSIIEALFKATAKPSASLESVLKKLAKTVTKAIWNYLKPIDLEKPKIYESVKNQLTLNWRTPWSLRVATGEDVY